MEGAPSGRGHGRRNDDRSLPGAFAPFRVDHPFLYYIVDEATGADPLSGACSTRDGEPALPDHFSPAARRSGRARGLPGAAIVPTRFAACHRFERKSRLAGSFSVRGPGTMARASEL